MTFNSYIFIFVFLPLSLMEYFHISSKSNTLSKVFLILLSLIFYAYNNINCLLPLSISLIVNYFIGKYLKTNNNKSILNVGIVFNIGLLGYFKYLNFFIDSFNSLFNMEANRLNIIMPLAISYFTFSQISFIVDSYRKEIIEFDLIDYLLYICYFPKMIQGPITFYNELIEQFNDENRRKINWDNIASGLYLFIVGLAEKVLIADVFGACSSYGISHIDSMNTTNTIIYVLSFTIQIYFDFNGYSNMAIGVSRMFNIELPQNFNEPYKSLSIADFWKRWHMSLTRFLTKYVYIPLGGNRKGKTRTYVNTLIVFTISGLWHGANWNYVIWGLVNGILLVLYKEYKNSFERFPSIIKWLLTFTTIVLLWIIFNTNSVKESLSSLSHLSNVYDFGYIHSKIYRCFRLVETNTLFSSVLHAHLWMYVYFAFAIIFIFFEGKLIEVCYTPSFTPLLIIFFVWSIVSLSGLTTFIYQGF